MTARKDGDERPVSLFPTTDRLATPAQGPEAVGGALSERPTNRAATSPDSTPDCDHIDGYGSTIIFVQNRPKDGVCMLCDEYFPGHLRVLR